MNNLGLLLASVLSRHRLPSVPCALGCTYTAASVCRFKRATLSGVSVQLHLGRVLSAEMASDIDVTEEAQKRLCRFSFLSHSVGMDEERQAALKKKLATLNDASEEVDVSFTDDDLWVKVGEQPSNTHVKHGLGFRV